MGKKEKEETAISSFSLFRRVQQSLGDSNQNQYSSFQLNESTNTSSLESSKALLNTPKIAHTFVCVFHYRDSMRKRH